MSSLFDSKRTTSQLKEVLESGLAHNQTYWNLGYPLLTEMFPTLRYGLWFNVAMENVGKTQVAVNLGLNVLKQNADAYWLDFSLDDSVEERLGYALACHSGIPIDLVHVAGSASDETKSERKKAFVSFVNQYSSRYHLIGISDRQKEAGEGEEVVEEWVPYSAEAICKTVMEARHCIGKDARLFVTIDGFHDMTLDAPSLNENDRQRQKSQYLKKWAQKAKALMVISTHAVKHSRQRGLTADSIKGDGTMLYDAKVIIQLYCDVNLNRENAVVAWYKDDEPERKQPVMEADVQKNKAGRAKKVIFLQMRPDCCRIDECGPEDQAFYMSCIYAAKKKETSKHAS